MYFSTRMVSDQEGRQQWAEAVRSAAGPFQVDFGGSAFFGSVEHRKIANFDMVRLSHTASRVVRSRRDLDAIEDAYFLFVQLTGELIVTQCEREAVLRAGDMTLIDARRISDFRFKGRNSLLCLHVDPKRIECCEGDVQSRIATRLCGTSASMLQAVMIAGFEAAACGDGQDNPAIETAISQLLIASIEPGKTVATPSFAPTPADPLLVAIREVTLSRLRDPLLSPSRIAAELHVTERQLHRAFKGSGLSLCRWIRQSRLDRCAAALRDISERGKSITEIAFEWGFNDVAHFSRSFRDEFGISPRVYRQHSLSVSKH